MRWTRWLAVTLFAGVALGAIAAFTDNVPLLLGEIGKARADRSVWSQMAEFVSLLTDAGWAWAATAVGVGWMVSAGIRPRTGLLVGALAGFVALTAATIVFYGINLLVGGDFYWVQVLFWWARSLLLGLPLGAMGAVIRRPPAGILAALVVPVGAVLNIIVLPPPPDSRVASTVVLTVCGGAAAATLLILVRAVQARRLQGTSTG
ncbi:hypothetical protein ACWERW_11340 [Streptomyces sp. NPDC004012]